MRVVLINKIDGIDADIGDIFQAEYTPIMYDATTFEKIEKEYLVVNMGHIFVKLSSKYFISESEWLIKERESRLSKILK